MTLVVLFLLSGTVVAVVHASRLSLRRRVQAGAVPSDPDLRRVHDRQRRRRLVGLASGLVAFVALLLLLPTRATLAAPVLLGLGAILGVAWSSRQEQADPLRPSELGPGQESGDPGRLADDGSVSGHHKTTGPGTTPLVPRRLTALTAAVWLLLLATAAVTTLTASPDAAGVPGRRFAVRCGTNTSLYGPYPGLFVTLPLAVVLVVAVVAAGVTWRRVSRQPRQRALRDAEGVVAGLLVAGGAGFTALSLALAGAGAVLSYPAAQCGGMPWAMPMALGATFVAVLAAGAAVHGVSLLLVPSWPVTRE